MAVKKPLQSERKGRKKGQGMPKKPKWNFSLFLLLTLTILLMFSFKSAFFFFVPLLNAYFSLSVPLWATGNVRLSVQMFL